MDRRSAPRTQPGDDEAGPFADEGHGVGGRDGAGGAGSGAGGALSADVVAWPGVADPARLLGAIADWLTGYGNQATRRTYAEGLGLPVSAADLAGWARPGLRASARAGQDEPVVATAERRTSDEPGRTAREEAWSAREAWATAIFEYAEALHLKSVAVTAPAAAADPFGPGAITPGFATHDPRTTCSAATTEPPAAEDPARAAKPGSTSHARPPRTRTAPPPAARGRLRAHHWFRWCASRHLDPVTATSAHVKGWLDDLATAGAAPATRDRMLATVKALYGYLADLGLVAGNPAALNRRRLGLAVAAAGTSGTVTLTTRQVRALYTAAGARRRGAGPLDSARAVAVVALFTLGLRVSELCDLDRADLHVTRGRRALRVLGKGGKTRVVYLSVPAENALTAYLCARDEAAASRETAVVRRIPQPGPQSPLIETRTGRRFQRQAIWQLLRRLTVAGGPELAPIAGAMHPHALRHFYVTTAVEAGAQLVHVQADVGHSSIDTTQQTYDHAARAPERSAVDLVASSWFPEDA
ncbi:tyrosine-type recombinase/integrase [Amycolatopsis sp. PS_44_ISF1]|uniref:tyrosine-type recombinase/integrase n=1 Tax=Amycolatopsis sp. PS_44_ISF1 TaxID=2974917 RepID=UPI0028DF76B5|nr:tyrosine-type recombinase/integrase [Amycolatopsis sp. PS_44_ISF1]MDT8912778.1 tyrosine-type recombinase/integrase [Amycolatopsis sp. PS_44_ISF1]